MSQNLSFIRLLNPDLLDVVGALWRWGKRAFHRSQGMYEVLEYKACLELLDSSGREAIYSKQERVRFLQDNIIAYQDQAWGDGEIFADYKCSPGIPVDRYAEGSRYRILISLRETKNNGDIEVFHIERKIRNGFTKKTEYFQNKVNHSMHKFSTSVIFPQSRLPRQVVLVEENNTRIRLLGAENFKFLPDGRQQVTWQTDKPRQHEVYSLRWTW